MKDLDKIKAAFEAVETKNRAELMKKAEKLDEINARIEANTAIINTTENLEQFNRACDELTRAEHEKAFYSRTMEERISNMELMKYSAIVQENADNCIGKYSKDVRKGINSLCAEVSEMERALSEIYDIKRKIDEYQGKGAATTYKNAYYYLCDNMDRGELRDLLKMCKLFSAAIGETAARKNIDIFV